MHMNPEQWTAEISFVLTRLSMLLTEGRPDVHPSAPSQTSTDKVLLKPEEAADRLGVGRTKVYALIKAGELQSVQIGRLRRIHVESVNTYAARLQFGIESHAA
jgi:excisionase family DNA binding protein